MIVTLPKEALKYLDDKIIKVEIDENLLKEEKKMLRIKKAKGILAKNQIDGLKYQKKIRKEYQRKPDAK